LIYQQRTALIRAAGQFSRPDRDELARRKKDGAKATKRKMENETEPLVKKQELDLLESAIFMAPKLLAAAELENKETLELETPRQCYVCKTDFTKMHHFYDTMCTDCGDFNYAKRFQTANVKGRLLSLRVHDKNRLSYYTDVASWWSNGYRAHFSRILHCVLGRT
jgi:hypothetical protein